MNNFFAIVKKFFAPPIFEGDEDKTRRARLLHIILVAQVFVLLLVLAGTLFTTFTEGTKLGAEVFIMMGGLLLIMLWRFLMWRGQVDAASVGMLIFFTLSITLILASGGTIRSVGVIFFPLVVVMATLLINRRAGVVSFFFTTIIGISLIQSEISGLLPTPQNSTTFASNVILIASMGLTLVLLYLATQGTDEALRRANEKEQEVREFVSTLEQRVAERTKALETSAEISHHLASILDPNELASAVVNQVQTAFNYYYAQIYLFDATSENLVLTAGTGEAGAAMLKRGHALPKGRGLVGRTADTKKSILVSDTSQDPNWLPNELLPDTKAEAVVPIFFGDKVLGVLDVQDNITNDITPADITLLESLASQVAISIRNARQYEETQQATAQLSEALDIAKLANWQYDVTRDRFIFNDHFYSIFHTTAELEGGYELSSAQYAQRLVHPDDVPLVGAAIEKALASKDRHYNTQLEHRVRYSDGGIGYISVNVHIERDSQGNITRYYGANQDITERKGLEELMTQRAKQQEAINVITQKIQSATTIESALQVTARELGRALGMKPTLVSLEPDIQVNDRQSGS